MAINPQIPLMARGIDLQQVLLGGLQGAQTLQSMQQAAAEAPLRQQALEQAMQVKQFEADLLKGGVAASRLKPFITNKDYEGFSKELQRAGLDPEDAGILDTYARANRWDAINTVADQYIQTARDAGVFGKDTAATSGYTPSAVQLFEYRKQLADRVNSLTGEDKKIAQRELRTFDNMVRAQVTYAGGGGTTIGMQPLSGEATVLPVEPTTGMGAPPTAPPPPTTGPAAQEVMGQPIETAPTPAAFTERADQTIARRNSQLRAAETMAEREAIRMEGYQFDFDTHRKMRSGLEAAFGEQGLGSFFKDLPEGRLSSAVNSAVSAFMGGTKGRDAEARMAQLSRLFLQGVPYDPGAQSNAELQARKELVGDLENPDISVQQKINSIKTYYRFLDARAESSREKLTEYYGKNPAMTAPSNIGMPATVAPSGAGQPTLRYVPGQGLMRIGGQ